MSRSVSTGGIVALSVPLLVPGVGWATDSLWSMRTAVLFRKSTKLLPSRFTICNNFIWTRHPWSCIEYSKWILQSSVVHTHWKPVFFASSQLVARSLYRQVIFTIVCSMNIELFNGICYIGACSMLSLLRFGKHGRISHWIVYIYSTKCRKSYPGRDVTDN